MAQAVRSVRTLLRRVRSVWSLERVQVGILHRGEVCGRGGGGYFGVEVWGGDAGEGDGAVYVAVRVFALHGREDDGERGWRWRGVGVAGWGSVGIDVA